MGRYFDAAWQNIKDVFSGHDIRFALKSPGRLRNLTWRIVESAIGLIAFFFAAAHGVSFLGSLILAIVAEFVSFEFVAEPTGWTGYYWERGPREGEGDPPDSGWWEE